MNTMENNKEKTKVSLCKWYDKRLMGLRNVRNGEGKRGYKCDISEAQHAPQLNLLHVFMQPCMDLLKNFWHSNYDFDR
jgi:hypothetical protein